MKIECNNMHGERIKKIITIFLHPVYGAASNQGRGGDAVLCVGTWANKFVISVRNTPYF